MYLVRQEVSSAPTTATPAMPAIPDFGPVSLETRGTFILTITSFFTAFACSAVLARLYVRAFMLKRVGIDDYILIIAMVSYLSNFRCS